MSSKNLVLLYNSINGPVFGSETASMNLGLLAISACLKKAGFEVKLVPNIEDKKTKRILRKLLPKTLMVGVSCMTGDPIRNGLLFSETVKKISPKTPVMWGGYQATVDFNNTAKEKCIDYIVRGQGERSVVNLALDLKKGKRKINKIIDCKEIEPIDNFPAFDYDLYFETYPTKKVEEIIYTSSRGCPFECTFCSVSNFYHKKYLEYSSERMMDDMNHIVKKYNPKTIFFWDDNFFVDYKRVNNFLDWYLETKQTFSWMAFSRCSNFSKSNPIFLKRLEKANLKKILFGAESGSPRILKYIKKHIVIKDIIDSCKEVSKYGIVPDYTFMTGLPTEKIKDLQMTLNVIRKLVKINPNAGTRIFSFCPSPGIPILTDCLKYGFDYPKKMSDWIQYEYHCYIAPWTNIKHKMLIRRLVWITTFSAKSSAPSSNKLLLKLAAYLLHLDAFYRLKYNFFYFAPEWEFVYSMYRKHYLETIPIR